MTEGPASRLAQRVDARLRSLGEAGLLRALRPPSGIDLSSNDYLGLAHDPRVVQAMVAGATREGCGSTGSRLLRGDRDVFGAIERRFAAFKGTERALYFSSGYLANLAVLTTLPERGDVILSDARNHASLVDAIRLSRADRMVFPHNDVAALDHQLSTMSSGSWRRDDAQVFVVVESVFSMDGDHAPLSAYAALCDAHGAALVVDEAHAVGLFGDRGSGVVEEAGLDGDVCVSMNAAGKALGVGGAFVAGPAWAIEYLVQRARPFIFSTAPPPAVAHALDASLDIVLREPDRRRIVLDRAVYFRRALASAGLAIPQDRSPIIPVVVGDNDRSTRVAAMLSAQGFDVRAIRPPSVPAGTARLRLSVNVSLGADVIDRFVAALVGALEAATPWPAVSS
jgi:8-amino-7-oxononanoate synthase